MRAAAALLVASITVSGCGDDRGEVAGAGGTAAGSGTPTESSTSAPFLSVVVLGDSIPYNSSDDCSGCRGFADSYADALGEGLGETVGVANLSRHDGARTRDIVDQLASGELSEPLAGADVVIMSVGFNDQPPYTESGQPCRADDPVTAEDGIEAVAATTPACVDRVTATLRWTVARGLREVRAQAPDAAIAVLAPYDSWNGWSAFEDVPVAKARSVFRVIAYALDAWRTALCAEALEVGGVCVDVYREFNGPDGRQPSGDLLAPDYTHPSQLGNDRIRDVLLAARLLG